jgi:hypothetical protein
MMLSDETISRCLKDIVPFNIKPDPPSLLISRHFLTDTYGGSPMTLLATSKSGQRFIFPTPDVNPDMPTSPGNPGLLFSCRKGMVGFTWSLFSRNQTNPTARWEYLGEYQNTVCGVLPSEEFARQRQKVYRSSTFLLDL